MVGFRDVRTTQITKYNKTKIESNTTNSQFRRRFFQGSRSSSGRKVIAVTVPRKRCPSPVNYEHKTTFLEECTIYYCLTKRALFVIVYCIRRFFRFVRSCSGSGEIAVDGGECRNSNFRKYR